MSELNEYKPFGQLLKKVIDNRGKTCPVGLSGFPLIATNCIKNENLYPVLEKVRYVSDDIMRTWFRGHPEPGDIIFVTKGSPGRVCWVPDPINFCIAQDMVAIRVDEKKIYPKYLFAALRSSIIKSEIENLHVGSLIPHFKKGDFDDLKIPIPKENLQRFVGDYYFDLSLKIDLLHRQNKTLESLAETLFRELNSNKKYSDVKLGDLVTVKGGSTPSTKISEYWDGNIYWATPRDLSNNDSIYLLNTDRKITQEGLQQISSDVLPIGTVLLSSRAPIGYLVITDIPVAVNQGFIALICDKLYSNYFIYCCIKHNLDYIINSSNGSVFDEISKSVFKTLTITIPDKEELDHFNKVVSPLFHKIKSNIYQIRTLTQLRDTLLPKLMNGEIKLFTSEV
jgi:type I restriction enzyme S subunit